MDMEILSISFIQACLKVYRANRHIEEVERNLVWYAEQDFCALIRESDAQGRHVFSVQTEPVPANLVLALGDAFHCFSAALDYIMTGIMRAETGGAKRISFPSHDTRDALEKSFQPPAKPGAETPSNRRIVEAVPSLADFLLNTIQPYRGGKFSLWEIRKADNIDKHNLVLPTLALGTLNGISLVDEMKRVSVGLTAHVPAGQTSKTITFPAANNIEVKKKGDPTLCVTFPDDAEVFAGDPILPTLTQCSQLISESIELIAAHLSVPKSALEFLRAEGP
jgi:hypothetical protein